MIYGGHILYYEHAVTIYFAIPTRQELKGLTITLTDPPNPLEPTEITPDVATDAFMRALNRLFRHSGKLPLDPVPDPDDRVNVLSVQVDSDDVDRELSLIHI